MSRRTAARRSLLLAAVAAGWVATVAPVVPPRALAGPTGQLEVWLDRPLPTDAAPGSTVSVGFILWDPAAEAAAPGSFPFLRLRPAAGTAEPSEADGAEDWAGHFVARLPVPEGGVGILEVGVAGSACGPDGCTRVETRFPIAGTGPPPGAPLPVLATATIIPPAQVVRAGEPFPLTVALVPRAGLDPAALPAPGQLVIRVGPPRGDAFEEVEVAADDPTTGRYSGSVTVADTGSYVLKVAVPGVPGNAGLFPTSILPLTVEAAAVPDLGAGVDPLVLAGIGGAVLLVVLVIRFGVARAGPAGA